MEAAGKHADDRVRYRAECQRFSHYARIALVARFVVCVGDDRDAVGAGLLLRGGKQSAGPRLDGKEREYGSSDEPGSDVTRMVADDLIDSLAVKRRHRVEHGLIALPGDVVRVSD